MRLLFGTDPAIYTGHCSIDYRVRVGYACHKG